mgnify:FL=1
MINILVINPNSSQKVTDNLEAILVAPEGTKFHFYTAPGNGPKEITPELSALSAEVALPDLLKKDLNQYDGFLVCCYSDHPLVPQLARNIDKPVLGIMQATLIYALLSARKLFILTSTNEWENVLDKGVIDFVGALEFPLGKFEKTKGLDVSVLSLSDPKEFAKITNRVEEVFTEYSELHIDCVLLGCAGMAGLDEKLTAKFPGVKFVDSCKVGVEILGGLIRFNRY